MNIPKIIEGPHFVILCKMEILQQFSETVSVTGVICLAGLILFGIWLLRTSWGRKALVDSAPRRNNMPLYLPFVALSVWFVSVLVTGSIGSKVMADLDDWRTAAVANAIYCIVGIIISGGAVFLARVYFARRLKGFGLDLRTIHKDVLAAGVSLLCVWPLVMVAIVLTTKFGKIVWGRDFEMQQHEQIELMAQYPQLSLRILIFVVAAVIAPVLEEILFRGLLQTAIRSFLTDLEYRQPAWLSIVMSSVLFAAAHPNAGHWPALFVLALCMGYAYEKSGSLFRPIFIHALFNGVGLLTVLIG